MIRRGHAPVVVPRVVRAAAAVVTTVVVLLASGTAAGQVPATPAAEEAGAVGRTPPRLSFVDGQVSFWRPGAEAWVQAWLNMALAPGDELYTGSPGNLELQIGGRAYVRAWAGSQLGLASLEPDFVQIKVTAGHVSLDLRRLDPGHTVELDTPNAAFTVERAGYYRVTVTENRTSFVTRRGGRALVTPANGAAAAVTPSEEVIIEGTDSPTVMTYVAPAPDVWDRWNYARTDALIDSVSARYVSPGVYGIDDLDNHGSWRVVENYGPVWVPTGMPAGWVPYSTGTWVWDPFYGWTWVDAAPWGWAPYHYGRWVFAGGFWAWAPGPIVVRPVYAPALVAFFGPRVGFSIGVAGPAVGWVALGWGEPIIPWWGPAGFIGGPRWLGWGGPRIVNNVVISHTTVVHAHEINVYHNASVRNAVTVVPGDRFGRGPVTRARVVVDPGNLEPLRGKPNVSPVRASLAPDATRGVRPPEAALRRTVVTTRPPEDPARWLKPQGIAEPPKTTAPPRLVPPPRASGAESPARPPFGASQIERPRSPQPPRPERGQPPSGALGAPAPRVSREVPASPPSGAITPPPRPAPPARGAAPQVQPPPAPADARGAPQPGPAPSRVERAPSRVEPAPPRVERGPSRVEPAPPRGEKPPSRVERPPATPTPPQAQAPPRAQAPPQAQAPPGRQPEVRQAPRPLPGEPANRLFPGRSPETSPRSAAPSVGTQRTEPPARAPAREPGSAEPGKEGARAPKGSQ